MEQSEHSQTSPLQHSPIAPLTPPSDPSPQPWATPQAVVSQPFAADTPAPSVFPASTSVTPAALPAPTHTPYAPHAPAPPPTVPPQDVDPVVGLQPQAVVQVLSPRGVEYAFLTIVLFTGAAGLTSALLALVNGETSFDVLAFPVALLAVSVPVFAWLFLRLKNAELQNPALRFDASKRKSTQFIQIVTFVIFFFTVIGLVTTMFAKVGGGYKGSVGKIILDVLVLLVVSGGILAYYWRDEHRG